MTNQKHISIQVAPIGMPGGWYSNDNVISMVDHDKHYVVARTGNPAFTPEANNTITRLVTASPELLEACKTALRLCMDREISGAIREILENAISKAKGE